MMLQYCVSCGKSGVTCPKQKTGTKGEPVSIAILTKPFLDLRKTTCQLQKLFHVLWQLIKCNILVDYARRKHLRIMIHVKYLLHTSWHYDARVTSTKVGVETLPRRRDQTQPRPYLPQERGVEHLTPTSQQDTNQLRSQLPTAYLKTEFSVTSTKYL